MDIRSKFIPLIYSILPSNYWITLEEFVKILKKKSDDCRKLDELIILQYIVEHNVWRLWGSEIIDEFKPRKIVNHGIELIHEVGSDDYYIRSIEDKYLFRRLVQKSKQKINLT